MLSARRLLGTIVFLSQVLPPPPAGLATPVADRQLSSLRLQEGFRISLFTNSAPGAIYRIVYEAPEEDR